MRRVKTVDDCNLSCNSETKRRMSRQQAKRHRMEKLKLKFNNVLNQISQLKQESHQDHEQLNHLLLSSERIERLSLQSKEKAKRICIESLDLKRRLTYPSAIEKQEISMFALNDQVITDSNQAMAQQHVNQSLATKCEKKSVIVEYMGLREDAIISEKEESNITATNEVRASQQNNLMTNVPSEVKEQSKISSNCFSQSKIKNGRSVKVGSGIEVRRNRFEQEWRSTSFLVVAPPPKKEHKSVQKRSPSIAPFIWAIFLSVLLLWGLSL